MKSPHRRSACRLSSGSALLLAPLIAARLACAADAPAPVRWNLGGSGGWDYLAIDAAAYRLYVTRGDRVLALNTNDGTIVGTIADTEGVHGVAIDRDSGKGYASNGRGDSVTEFDLASLQTLRVLPIPGHNPDAIVFEPATKRVWTFNGKSHDATAIDAASGEIVATVPLGGKPEFAVADGQGQIFVNDEDHAMLNVIDAKARRVTASWKLEDCDSPSGLALDGAHHRLFSVCANEHLVVTDAQSGKHVATVPIGKGPDAVAYDPALHSVYSPNGQDGTLTIIHQIGADEYAVAATVPTQRSARTFALDTSTHRLYFAAATLEPAPPATADQPRPRPSMVPDSFCILVVDPVKTTH